MLSCLLFISFIESFSCCSSTFYFMLKLCSSFLQSVRPSCHRHYHTEHNTNPLLYSYSASVSVYFSLYLLILLLCLYPSVILSLYICPFVSLSTSICLCLSVFVFVQPVSLFPLSLFLHICLTFSFLIAFSVHFSQSYGPTQYVVLSVCLSCHSWATL